MSAGPGPSTFGSTLRTPVGENWLQHLVAVASCTVNFQVAMKSDPVQTWLCSSATLSLGAAGTDLPLAVG